MKPTSEALEHLRSADPFLATLIDRYPLSPLNLRRDYFASLVESIISQQLSDKAAATICNRFKALFSRRKSPSPQEVLNLPNEVIRGVGISFSKVSYIKNVAEAIVSKKIDIKKLPVLDDETVIEELSSIKGIGRWTAEMFLIFSLGRPDVFSFGDLGLQNAIKKLYRLRKDPTRKKLHNITKHWKPYRSTASLYLWASLDNRPIL